MLFVLSLLILILLHGQNNEAAKELESNLQILHSQLQQPAIDSGIVPTEKVGSRDIVQLKELEVEKKRVEQSIYNKLKG